MVVSNAWLRTSSPNSTLNGACRQLDRRFDDYASALNGIRTMPAEVVESADELRLTIEVPGLGSDDIELTVENGVLTVSGEKKNEHRDGDAGYEYRLAERHYGRYSRR